MKIRKIILGSKSPRRQELLKGLDIDFEIDNNFHFEEIFPADMPHNEVPQYLAKAKSSAFHRELECDEMLLTADTMVLKDSLLLGKPKNYAEAFDMLKQLSNSKHQVITGVCLRTKDKVVCFSSISEVYFNSISDEEISYYLTKYKPYDKAGSYGVQEWIGYAFVNKIEGSFYNIMGLPIDRVYEELKAF